MASDPQYAPVPTHEAFPAAHIPLPPSTPSLIEPRPPFHALNYDDSPRDSTYAPSSIAGSAAPLGVHRESTYLNGRQEQEVNEKTVFGQSYDTPSPRRKRSGLCIALIALIALVVVALAVVLPVYFVVIKPKNSHNLNAASSHGNGHGTNSSTGGGTDTNATTPATNLNGFVTGGDGSTIKSSDGTSFVYNNSFGGIWWSDPNDPFNNNAYPNSWTPPLNQSWDFGKDRIYGVNLGGWFVLEPFISPALFQKYPGAVDEFTLSTLMAADTANGGLSQLEDHYKTFITEQDIAQIAGVGLNWVRIPIPFWAIETWPGEPYLAKTSWKYILQAFEWCRKYGLRVKLDLHTIPGSQNGLNHSGRLGTVNFLSGVMGMANAQRGLNYMRILTEFISQPEYKDLIPIFGIMNEALVSHIGREVIRGFYIEAYDMIRGITGIGEGKGPMISIHDGFQGIPAWGGFLNGADRVALDSHPYFAFDGSSATAPIDTGVGAGAGGTWPADACKRWGSAMNTSREAFGVTFAGEWSNGFNDCGLFLKGIPGSHTYGGNCDDWQDSTNWTPGTKAGLLAFATAQMDTFRDWFFWTWKIGESNAGIVQSPLWSYQLGLQNGWMPTDPRTSLGFCADTGPDFSGSFEPWMTGAAASATIDPAQRTSYPYPPASLTGAAAAPTDLPVYSYGASIITMPMPSFTNAAGKNVPVKGNGWFNQNDNVPGPTPIAGCSYPDEYNANDITVPSGCTSGTTADVFPSITPPPSRRSS
ncbi:glycoside hydrolase [Agrocybe pediades]|nr:glycoside hydrolase [Agrocybe pediades]